MSPNDHNWVRGWFVFDPLCLAYLATMGLYFIVLEGWLGATLGKWILGLRVIGLDGGRAGLWKGIVRNALRLVDGLPAFNLLGVILVQRSKDRARYGTAWRRDPTCVQVRRALQKEYHPLKSTQGDRYIERTPLGACPCRYLP